MSDETIVQSGANEAGPVGVNSPGERETTAREKEPVKVVRYAPPSPVNGNRLPIPDAEGMRRLNAARRAKAEARARLALAAEAGGTWLDGVSAVTRAQVQRALSGNASSAKFVWHAAGLLERGGGPGAAVGGAQITLNVGADVIERVAALLAANLRPGERP